MNRASHSPLRDRLLVLVFSGLLLTGLSGYCHFMLRVQLASVRSSTPMDALAGRLVENPFPKPRPSTILDGSWQKGMEAACQENLPMRNRLLESFRRIERTINETMLKALPDRCQVLRPMGGNVVTARNGGRLLWRPSLFRMTDLAAMEKRAAYYRNLTEKFPDIKVYVLADIGAVAWWLRSKPYPAPVLERLDDGKYADEFRKMLPPQVRFSSVPDAGDPAAVLHGYFASDHHWNIRGAWAAYAMLWRELSADMADLGPLRPLGETRELVGVRYQGSRAFQAMAPDWFDRFEVATRSFADLGVTIPYTGGSHRGDPPCGDPADGTVRPDFFRYYAAVYGGDLPQVIYGNPKSGNRRSLVVIGDSMDNSLEPWLASHFARTIFADTRYMGESVESLVGRENPDALVFIGQQQAVLGFGDALK